MLKSESAGNIASGVAGGLKRRSRKADKEKAPMILLIVTGIRFLNSEPPVQVVS